MAVIKYRPLPHPVYEVYLCRTMNRIYEVDSDCAVDAFLFRIKIYLIFSDCRVYTFFNQSDWIDNVNLMRECGSSCSTFTHDIYVSPTSHPDIYKEIRDYVSKANSDT